MIACVLKDTYLVNQSFPDECWYITYFYCAYTYCISIIVHRCEPGGSTRVCHAAGPGSIPGRDKFLGEVFRGFSSPVRQMSGSFKPPRSPNIIWLSLSSPIIIHYRCQWPEMLTCPENFKYTYIWNRSIVTVFRTCMYYKLLAPMAEWYLTQFLFTLANQRLTKAHGFVDIRIVVPLNLV